MPPTPSDPGVALLAAQLHGLRDALGAVPVPPPALEGWESLCATEYARAVLRLDAALRAARVAVGDAVAQLAA